MDDDQDKIGRDALEVSGLRASLQRRSQSTRKAKAPGVEPEAEYLRDRPGELTELGGHAYRIEYSALVTTYNEKGKPFQYTAVRIVPA
jgi:hypothetical protein